MKKIIVLFSLALLISCAKEESCNEVIHVQQIEEYRPGTAKELYMTKSGIPLEVIDSVYVLEGDILLSKEQVDELNQPGTKGGILTSPVYAWPNGIVYFEFQQTLGMFTFTQTQKVYDAMNYYHLSTGVEFRYVTYKNTSGIFKYTEVNEKDYIQFIESDGNWSYLGRKGGKQQIGLELSSTPGIVMHELGHAIGLLHEHSRADRNQYIDIFYGNILPKFKSNFDITGGNQTLSAAFDFDSIMLYSAYNNFAVNPLMPTMQKKNGSYWFAQRDYLSAGDLQIIRYHYPKFPCGKVLPQ